MNINLSMQGINSFKSGQEGGFQQGVNAMKGVGKPTPSILYLPRTVGR